MRWFLLSAALVGLLVLPAAAFATMSEPGRQGPAHDSSVAPTANATLAATPTWPTRDVALHALKRFEAITIRAPAEFNAAHGVISGHGTAADPYVIANLFTPTLIIRNVSAAVTIRHVFVGGDLILDWTDHAHDTPATWAIIERNRIGDVVLRHAGGAFNENDVGPLDPIDAAHLSLEVQGYEGLRVANNTVRGPSEFRLHGHHFAESFDMAWMAMDMMQEGLAEDRYHALTVEGNTFLDPTGGGVTISDRDHAANDRTANSEPNPALNGTHRHFTLIQFQHNTLSGAGITIVNADALDPHHEAGGSTRIDLLDDPVTGPFNGIAVAVRGSHGANITIADARLTMERGIKGTIGVLLTGIDAGSVRVSNVTLQGFETGMKADHLAKQVTWTLANVSMVEVTQQLSLDKTAKSVPQRQTTAPPPQPRTSDPHAGHVHSTPAK